MLICGPVINELRLSGTSVALTDLVIAVAATGAEATLWTKDRDFERIRRMLLNLELRLD